MARRIFYCLLLGDVIATSPTHNILKRLNKYAKMYGLKNKNPHAMSRGFTKSLLDKVANVAVISKALDLYVDEVVNNLRSTYEVT